MDLLQKNGLALLAVFFRIAPFFSFAVPPFFKPSVLKLVRTAAFFLVFLISSMFASRPVFSEASPKISAQALKDLNLRAFKRELHLPKTTVGLGAPHYSALYAHYLKNHFQKIVKEIDLLPEEQQDGDILILYGNTCSSF